MIGTNSPIFQLPSEGDIQQWQKEFIGEPVEGEPNSFRGGVVFAD